ncbi:hypothetical protein AB4156_16345 [Cupriavidus sp. 2MCAB6]|uniref:hypothetical protein n=1 Tax=Cupriavidus sp. 2MCAB6 TaxID=3232981 RepID=UPI003F9035A8
MNRLTEFLKAAVARVATRAPALKAAAALIASWLPDSLMAFGAWSIAHGAWMIYAPAGHIVGGTLAIAGGVLLARGAR